MSEILWTAGFLNERFPGPVSPLGWSIVGPLIEELALRDPLRWMGYPAADAIPALRLYRGHPYANVAIFQILYRPFPDALVPEDAYRYFPDGDLTLRKQAPYPRSLFQPRFLWSLFRHALRDLATCSPLNAWVWQRYAPRHGRAARGLAQELAALPEGAGLAAALLSVLRRTDDLHRNLLSIHRWSLTYADLAFALLKHLTGTARAEQIVAHTPNMTIQVNRDLQALQTLAAGCPGARQARGLTELRGRPECAEFVSALERFLAKHGHRSPSLDPAHSTWADEPSLVLDLLRAQFEIEPPLPQPLSGLDRALARLAGPYVTMREDQRYAWTQSLAVTRLALSRLGHWMACQAILERPEDLWYAERGEVEAAARGELSPLAFRSRIQTRREEWRVYEADFAASPVRAYPPFLLGDAPWPPQAKTGFSGVWRGRGISPGRTQGAVRVARAYADLRSIQPGEILVTLATDPAWTPVFGRLGGLVLEWGGVLSHGAVVAREYGLAAVSGLPGITEALHDGDWIQVDGTEGIVRRVYAKPG